MVLFVWGAETQRELRLPADPTCYSACGDGCQAEMGDSWSQDRMPRGALILGVLGLPPASFSRWEGKDACFFLAGLGGSVDSQKTEISLVKPSRTSCLATLSGDWREEPLRCHFHSGMGDKQGMGLKQKTLWGKSENQLENIGIQKHKVMVYIAPCFCDFWFLFTVNYLLIFLLNFV